MNRARITISSMGLTNKGKKQYIDEYKVAKNLFHINFETHFAGHHRDHRHYSYFVFLMKILLSGLAISLVSLVVIWPKLSNSFDKVQFNLVNSNTLEASRIVNARYHSTNEDQQPFTITSELATESIYKRLNLLAPKANLNLKDGSWLTLLANNGWYQHDKLLLDLDGDVLLSYTDGYCFHTCTAQVEFKTGIASGSRPITGYGPLGTLSGQGFQVLDNGGTVVLMGRSRVLIRLNTVSSATKDNTS